MFCGGMPKSNSDHSKNSIPNIYCLKDTAERTLKLLLESEDAKLKLYEKLSNVIRINVTLRDISRRGTNSFLMYSGVPMSLNANDNRESLLCSLKLLIDWCNQFISNHDKLHSLLFLLSSHDGIDRYDSEPLNNFDVATFITTMAQQIKPLKVTKFCDGPAIQIGVGNVMSVVLVVHNNLITSIVTRAHSEEGDVWKRSKYTVFDQVNNFVIGAHNLICCNPHRPLYGLRRFIFLLQTYADLFTKKCFVCNKILRNLRPPTMRLLEDNSPFHPDCN